MRVTIAKELWLGFAIVNEIMARHGGDAWAEPEPNNGVTFHLSISKNL